LGGLEAREQRLDGRLIGFQESLALRRDVIALAPAVFGFCCGVAHVLEPGQRWIDHAGARGIAAAHALFDRLHQLVAVARRLADQRQRQDAQLAVIEKARAAPAPVPHPAAFMAFGPLLAVPAATLLLVMMPVMSVSH